MARTTTARRAEAVLACAPSFSERRKSRYPPYGLSRHPPSLRGVVCQPDRPSGRGLQLHAPAVKVARARARRSGRRSPSKCERPTSRRGSASRRPMSRWSSPMGVFFLPRCSRRRARGCVNLHASILPELRGAAPINWAIARGETRNRRQPHADGRRARHRTGVRGATHRDRDDETAGVLSIRLGELAAEVIREDLRRAVSGELTTTPENEAEATLAPLLEKKDGQIDWNRPAQQVHDHVRGMTPWPGAFTHVGGKMIKVLATRRSISPRATRPRVRFWWPIPMLCWSRAETARSRSCARR